MDLLSFKLAQRDPVSNKAKASTSQPSEVHDPSTQEVEAGEYKFKASSGLHRESLSQKSEAV